MSPAEGSLLMAQIRNQLNRFLGAVVFLTRIPVGNLYIFRAEDLPRSVVYFPVIGLLIGLLAGLVLLCADLIFPANIAVLLCMLTSVSVTGALHEDGTADAADGFAGGSTPWRRLEIMRESTLGVYGVVALWFSLTAKFLLLSSLLEKGTVAALSALVIANGLGRAGTVALLFACPYAREGESKASPFSESVTPGEFVLSLLLPIFLTFVLLGHDAFGCLCGATAAVWAASYFSRKMIGGITGDCLGATNQLIELLCYLSLTARLSPGQ
jgi:adenosylcobinamide-GDP ribazoletransferase